MLSDLERRNLQCAIAAAARGAQTSRAAGNQRNAELLAARWQNLENRLVEDDRQRLVQCRRSIIVQDRLIAKTKVVGNKTAAARCAQALDQAFADAGELAARVEARSPNPASLRKSPTSTGVNLVSSVASTTPAEPEAAGSFTDLRTGQRVVCGSLAELRARVFRVMSELSPASPFGGFGGLIMA